jgi:hypothetical protein
MAALQRPNGACPPAMLAMPGQPFPRRRRFAYEVLTYTAGKHSCGIKRLAGCLRLGSLYPVPDVRLSSRNGSYVDSSEGCPRPGLSVMHYRGQAWLEDSAPSNPQAVSTICCSRNRTLAFFGHLGMSAVPKQAASCSPDNAVVAIQLTSHLMTPSAKHPTFYPRKRRMRLGLLASGRANADRQHR